MSNCPHCEALAKELAELKLTRKNEERLQMLITERHDRLDAELKALKLCSTIVSESYPSSSQ